MSTTKLMQLRIFSQKNSSILALNRKSLKNWNLFNHQEVPITFGHRRTTAVIRTHKGSEEEIWVSRDLAEKLLIPYPDRLHVKTYPDHISLGPIVGIVTANAIQKEGFPITENWKKYISNLLKHQHSRLRGGCYFVFDIEGVNWDQLTVEGVFYRPDHNGSWERKVVPFPDVVYNKILSRNKENSPESQRFLNLLYEKTNAQIFNEKYFQKWDIYERLTEFDEIADWVPETYYNPDIRQIKSLLNRYRIVYFKPVDGYMGLGIYQVHDQGGKIIARFRRKNNNIVRRYSSLEAFLKKEMPERKRRNYVVQQGIPLIRRNGHPLDFRVHLNKNIHNEWEVTGIGAKVAGKGSITTHVKAGGKILSSEEVLEEAFPNESDYFIQELIHRCITIAHALELSFNKPIGELGMDMGIDHNGKIWLFEVNSKPGRSIFQKINSLKANASYSTKLILDYSVHLANFT